MQRCVAALFAVSISAYALPANAVVVHGRVWQATYVAAYQPTFGPSRVPFSGKLKLHVNNGIVSGTYVSESVRPDPLYGRTLSVNGGISQGHVTLDIAASGGFTVRGTLEGDGTIRGTATIRGGFYTFVAKVKS
ncbi:MAG: hypothetical protein JO078_04885 [Candidatus Eremiobacteraeota bacterium]|nr:hypothetical protein [Candidatus Eremiobacteraeota bacterium]MBV9699442.1 hypothetical protein [Candidatus Eremiobacteraeota bacterium]